MNARTTSVLRWLAVVPGALAIAVGSTFVLHWILYFTLAHGETVSGVDIRPIDWAVYPSVAAFALIMGGAELAPSSKPTVAFALFSLWITVFVGLLVTMASTQVEFGLRALTSVATAVAALLIARHRFRSTTPSVNGSRP